MRGVTRGTNLLSAQTCRLLLVPVLSAAFAVAAELPQQTPDRLVYRGEVFSLRCHPLEAMLRKGAVSDRFIGVRTRSASRGYIATFSLPGDRLMLNDLDVFARDYPWLEQPGRPVPGEPGFLLRAALDRYFPRFEDRFMGRFRGILVIDLADAPLHAEDRDHDAARHIRLFRIEDGQLVETATMTSEEYEQYRRRQFETFKSTDRYRTYRAERLHAFEDQAALDRELYTSDRRFPMEMVLSFAPAPLKDPEDADEFAKPGSLYEHR